MNTRKFLVASGAVLLITAAVCPGTLLAFKLLGFSLPIGTGGNGYQRDFRLNNNFGDASANNNDQPDSQYPGVLGASMAFWKAGAVWDSDKAAKNFDFDWQSDLPTSAGSATE